MVPAERESGGKAPWIQMGRSSALLGGRLFFFAQK
jgi:hypothetical protein